MSATVVLTAREFAELVDPVLPHASKDVTLPTLCAIRVQSHGRHVSAIASDRYRIGWKRVLPAEVPEAGFDAVIPTRVVARLRKDFQERRGVIAPTLRLTVESSTLTVEAADYLLGMSSATLRFDLPDTGMYPPLHKLVFDAAVLAPSVSSRQSINPRLIAAFEVGQMPNVPMTVSIPAGNKPWFVTVGEDFVGAVVPTRLPAEESTYDMSSWRSLVEPEPAAEKAVA